ncbi:hypothetical protein ODJ79_41730 [Actinoplanes sp. KI2]|nr:hypothetical protein [Actinoplanes sp. KI2]MCU7730278.1 hypothetical protein [Actinoplanes sp. KI2]
MRAGNPAGDTPAADGGLDSEQRPNTGSVQERDRPQIKLEGADARYNGRFCGEDHHRFGDAEIEVTGQGNA